MSWQELQQPYPVTPGDYYYFGMVVPGDWTSDDIRKIITSQPGGVWNNPSIHPGAVSGLFRTYEVVGQWNGPQTVISDSPLYNITYAAMYHFVPDVPQEQPTTPPETPAAPAATEVDWTGWIVGGVVLLAGVAGLTLLGVRTHRGRTRRDLRLRRVA